LGWGHRAFAVLEDVSLIAGNAGSTVVEGGTLVGNRNADSVTEDPIVGALQTDLSVPVPRGTSYVSDLLNGGEGALSVLEIVSFVAGNTGATVVEGSALVGDGDADFVLVEDPIVGALYADLLIPVPCGASDV
jgi:hypothetical protein